jgi:AraC-like DNA-binding protein
MIDIVDLFNACLYIEDHLDTDLSLMFLAQTVGLSRFRFHRVFKAWRGETVHDFVTRMRMERAALELSYPVPRSSRRSIKAIAFASGYKSLSSFSHAFSSYAKLSPRAFRNRALQRRPAAASADSHEAPFGRFSIAVSEEPERRIAVLEPPVATREETTLAALAERAERARIDGDRYGVASLPNLLARAHGDHSLPTRSARRPCVAVPLERWVASSNRGAPRTSIRLEAGRYAVLEGRGSVRALYRAWRRGFDRWLAATGECPGSGRLFVRFAAAREATEANALVALYIPLEELPNAAPRARRSLQGPGSAAVS